MYRYDLFLHLSRPNPTMISLIDKEKINDAKKDVTSRVTNYKKQIS